MTHAGQVVLSPGADSGATLKKVSGLAPYVSRILNQPATSLQFPHGEGQLFVNSRQIPALGWVIVVLQQNDPSKAALLSILAQNLLIALAVSAVVLLLAASSSSAEPIAPPTLSCGVTTYQHGETLKELLLRADQVLYTAKRGGRDRVVCLEAEAPLLGRIDPKPSTAA
ncbi:diguanylate cyclase [Cyanobium sp. BA5m-21]|uniref:GGDEF domain-containing protein n=1 Tax=unclassified Cyanobium TaxID=2627006 RepID=UPI0020CCEBA3|nr:MULTISPECIES: diguanylate cyclase [unclassified Cyanobium]MCP9903097.1 diguanylate cyclase [Cyanobium sp. BA5m-10]MCP9906607.1 diguanylate cyclase [Cyanobium sp. BA5m-21]